MGVRRSGLYSLPAAKVLALALAVASQATAAGATDSGSGALPQAAAGDHPPPIPDCHAPSLNAEKLYQVALTIGETSPPEITRDDFERITGVRFGSPKDTLLGSHKTHELAYECAGTGLQVVFAEYRGLPESGNAGDTRGDGKYKGAYIQEAWKVDPILCIHRERVLDDQRRRGWISTPGNGPPEAAEAPNIGIYYTTIHAFHFSWNFSDPDCLNYIGIHLQ